jgi:hypothetical protein
MPRRGSEIGHTSPQARGVTDPTAQAFLDAARYAGAVVASPAIGKAWHGTSALERMTVGSVAGHTFLVLRRVALHLDAPAGDAGTSLAISQFQWLRVESEADLDAPEHRRVREDGDHVAAWGWEDVCAAYAARLEGLRGRLADPVPETVLLGERTMALDAYLGTRIVELLTHADDLAVSVGLTLDPLPEAAAGIAIGTVASGARRLHGDLQVLRTFVRPARTAGRYPSVLS